MKKVLMIVAVVATIIIISLTTGCLIQENIKLNKTKEEIIKFDEEYWKIYEEWGQPQIDGSKSHDDLISAIKKIQKDHSEYILKFKSINIPKPLDEFYYKKIEQFNSYQMVLIKASNSETTAKELETLVKETNELQLEANKIQRAVYREYGLDDLITKWQK